MSTTEPSDLYRLSSGPIGHEQALDLKFDNDDDDDGPPALQMSSEELAALQNRFKLQCDVDSDSESDEDIPNEDISKANIPRKNESSPCSLNQDSSCLIPTDSMILENKTIYENMLHEDPNNQTSVDKWTPVNDPKYISRPAGWHVARPNDLVQLTVDEYLSLGSEPIGKLGELQNLSAFEKAGLPSVSPALSSSSADTSEKKTEIPEDQKLAESQIPDTSVNIDYLLQPTNSADVTLESTTMSSAPKPTENIAVDVPNVIVSKPPNEDAPQPDSGRDTDRQSTLSEAPSFRSNTGSGSIDFTFNNGSSIADATDPDLAAVDAMLEMYDADVDPDELAEHIMMRFGVNTQRPGSTSGIFNIQDESLLRPPDRRGLSPASVVSSTPKTTQPKNSRPPSTQSDNSKRQISRPASSNSIDNTKRISSQSASSSVATVTETCFVKPAKPDRMSDENSRKGLAALSQSNISLTSSFDASALSDYAPLTPIADKGPYIRLEWNKLAIDLSEQFFVGQAQDFSLTARNVGRLWVQLSATVQSAKVDGTLLPGPRNIEPGLHVLNSTVVIEPNSSGTFRLRFQPTDKGFYSANIDLFACVVGSVIDESKQLPPIPFSADVKFPSVAFDSSCCDFGAIPAGASKRVICSLRLNEIPNGKSDVPVVLAIRPESAWRCFHFLSSSDNSKFFQKNTTPLFGAGHGSKIVLNHQHPKHDIVVCFTARYDAEVSPNQQGLDLNEAEIVAQTDTTPPKQLSVIPMRACVGSVALKAVGLDVEESTTLRLSCLPGSNVARQFFVVNSGSIAVDVKAEITMSQSENSKNHGPFSCYPNQFTLLPKQKIEITAKFEPESTLQSGDMCAGFISFFTDPSPGGSPGEIPALDVSLIGLVAKSPRERSIASTSGSENSASFTSQSSGQSFNSNQQQRRALVTSHQRVVWWSNETGLPSEQVVNLRNVGSDEVSVRISIRDHLHENCFYLVGSNSQSGVPLLANIPPNSDFPMKIAFKSSEKHYQMASIAKLQIKVLASGAGSVQPGLKFCIPLFGCAGQANLICEGNDLKTTSAGHFYSIIGTVPNGARRTLRLNLRNVGSRQAFFAALPFTDMSCTQRMSPAKLVCTPPYAVIREKESIDVTVDMFIGERESNLCAERSYIVACLQLIFGENDLRVMAGRALKALKNGVDVRKHLDENCLELVQGNADGLPNNAAGNLNQIDAWPEHMKLFSKNLRRLYVALVGERTNNNVVDRNGDNDFDETIQHTMLLDDTQATILNQSTTTFQPPTVSVGSLVEQKSAQRPQISVAPSLSTVIDSPNNAGKSTNSVRLLPAELLLTALSDSRTLMLINDSNCGTDFEAEWPGKILAVEPPRGYLQPNGTATVHVKLAPGAANYVDPNTNQWVDKVGIRVANGSRFESLVRVHLSGISQQQNNSVSKPRQMQASRSEPCVQIVYGDRQVPHPPAARLDFGKIVVSNNDDPVIQRKVQLRLENEQPFSITWQLEELTTYALVSLPGQTNSSGQNRCVGSIFEFQPKRQGSLPANGGQTMLKCVFQLPSRQVKDANYLQHFLLSIKGATGWTAETRISVVASVSTSGSGITANDSFAQQTPGQADISQMSRVSNSSNYSVAPLSNSRRDSQRLSSTSRYLVCPGDRHEFKSVIKPGESVKEKINLENRSREPVFVEVVNGPSAPFSIKHRKFQIESMHYLHLPVVFRPPKSGTYRSEMTLQAFVGQQNSNGDSIPDELLTIQIVAKSANGQH